jgi:hypothetical protein
MKMGSSSNRLVGTMKVVAVTVTATATVTVMLMLMANEVGHAFTTPSLEARWILCEAATTTTRKGPHGSCHYDQLDRWFLVKLDGTNNNNNNEEEEASMDVKVAISNSDAYDSIELVKDHDDDDDDIENFRGISNLRNKLSTSDIDVQVEDNLPWIDFSQIQERNDEKSNLPQQQLPLYTSTVIFVTSLISTLYMYYVGIFGPSSSLSPTTIDPPNITF